MRKLLPLGALVVVSAVVGAVLILANKSESVVPAAAVAEPIFDPGVPVLGPLRSRPTYYVLSNYAQYMSTCHADGSVFVFDWKVEKVADFDPAIPTPYIGEPVVASSPWPFEFAMQMSVSRREDGQLVGPPCTKVTMGSEGGLFGDEVIPLSLPDTSGWKTYYGPNKDYTFRYPPDWQFVEYVNAGRVEYYGQSTYPAHAVEVVNPLSEQGQNIADFNCHREACLELPPNALKFRINRERQRRMRPKRLGPLRQSTTAQAKASFILP